MNTTNEERKFRPTLNFYKANAKGSGCAMELEVHPAHDSTDGSLMVKLANQMIVGDLRGPNPVYPRFDWEHAITIKLGFLDLSMMLQVFRGECEEIGEGKGIFHRSSAGQTKITFKHLIDPVAGYSLDVYRTMNGTREERHAHILLTNTEASGLMMAIEGSLAVIAFGMPMVIPHPERKATFEKGNNSHALAS